MKVVIGSDHAGFHLKKHFMKHQPLLTNKEASVFCSVDGDPLPLKFTVTPPRLIAFQLLNKSSISWNQGFLLNINHPYLI